MLHWTGKLYVRALKELHDQTICHRATSFFGEDPKEATFRWRLYGEFIGKSLGWVKPGSARNSRNSSDKENAYFLI